MEREDEGFFAAVVEWAREVEVVEVEDEAWDVK